MKVTGEEFQGQMELGNRKLIELSMLLFQRMSVPVKKVMNDGKRSMMEISKVVLVGGSCKMSAVQQYLRHMISDGSITAANLDYMVALGTGIYAGIKERRKDIKDLLLTNICPFTLETLMSAIIERNTVLPCSRTSRFQTAGTIRLM